VPPGGLSFSPRPGCARRLWVILIRSRSRPSTFHCSLWPRRLRDSVAAFEQRWAVALPFPSFAGPVGLTALVVASAIGLWSAVAMSTLGEGTPLPSAMANRLVIAGPYRWVRNPMAVAGVVQGAAVGLILQSWFVVAYAVVGSLVWNSAVRPLEEFDLKERFGDEFQRYHDTVSCWIPRMSRKARSNFDGSLSSGRTHPG
jgi:protein-S-isoprenylcysteine O-methyltransferase Ste14